jgi:hypothetical protein
MLKGSNTICRGLNKMHLILETLCIILLRGIKDDCMDALNLMGYGDVSQMTYDDIYVNYENFIHEVLLNLGEAPGI